MHPEEFMDDLSHVNRQVLFEVGDKVTFSDGLYKREVGEIKKINPKRAVVHCETGSWNVPYAILKHACEATLAERSIREERLTEVANHARALMNQYGLQNWRLRFNSAKKYMGKCDYEKNEISLSRFHSINQTHEQVTDLILHEIAHALAGLEAGHGPKWKEIAVQLGARPKACAETPNEILEKHQSVKNRVQVEDLVTFKDRQGRVLSGIVLRKNPKTATVRTSSALWRVPYGHLTLSHHKTSG